MIHNSSIQSTSPSFIAYHVLVLMQYAVKKSWQGRVRRLNTAYKKDCLQTANFSKWVQRLLYWVPSWYSHTYTVVLVRSSNYHHSCFSGPLGHFPLTIFRPNPLECLRYFSGFQTRATVPNWYWIAVVHISLIIDLWINNLESKGSGVFLLSNHEHFLNCEWVASLLSKCIPRCLASFDGAMGISLILTSG